MRRCILSYSDLSHSKVMEIAGRVLASEADFALLCPERAFVTSTKPVCVQNRAFGPYLAAIDSAPK
jgi:predicted GTPase